MKIDDVRKIATQHGIKAGKAKKSDLVRAIQQAEGHQPCFDSDSSAHCGQPACLWREDCS